MLQLDSQSELYIQREIELARRDLKRACQQHNQNPSTPLDTPVPSQEPVKTTRPVDDITVAAQLKPTPKPSPRNVVRAVPAVLPKQLTASIVPKQPSSRIVTAKSHTPTAAKQLRHSYHIRPPQKQPLPLEDSFIETLLDQIVLDDIQRNLP